MITLDMYKDTNIEKSFIFCKAVAEREDVSVADKKRAVKEYGDVNYADEKNKKYPIDAEHIRAAVTYFSKPDNFNKYDEESRKTVARKIMAAAKKMLDNFDEKSWKEKFGL